MTIHPAAASLTIRVQARGGMYLGPDSFNGALITVTNLSVQPAQVLLDGPTSAGDSGSRQTSHVPAASPAPIITPGTQYTPPATYWVVAHPTTASATVDLSLAAPALLQVEARVPLPPEQREQRVSTQLWVAPDQLPAAVPGLVLEVPGLWIQPELVVSGSEVNLKSKVTMMCGCEINTDLPWIPQDFQVAAYIKPQGSDAATCVVALDFEVNSQFTGMSPQLQAGAYVAEIVAYQLSTGNTGVARKTFEIDG